MVRTKKLKGANLALLEQAIRTGVLVCRIGKHAVADAYWQFCSENKRPFVWVRPRKSYASIQVDLQPCGTWPDGRQFRLTRRARELIRRAVLEFYLRPRYSPGYSVSDVFVWLPCCPIAVAEEFARVLFEIASSDVSDQLATRRPDLMVWRGGQV